MKMSNVLAASPVSPSHPLARIRWPVDDTGMNSVTPSISPSSAALTSGSATITPARRGHASYGFLVQGLVHGHDAVGRELARLGDRGIAHGGVPAAVAEELDGPAPHGLHRSDRLEDPVHPVV